MIDTLLRWTVSALGAAAVTGGLFLVMPSMIRIGDPEPGRALIAWQEANPQEYGGAFAPEQVPIYVCFISPHIEPNWLTYVISDMPAFADFRLAYQRKLAFRYRYRDPIPLTELNIHHLP